MLFYNLNYFSCFPSGWCYKNHCLIWRKPTSWRSWQRKLKTLQRRNSDTCWRRQPIRHWCFIWNLLQMSWRRTHGRSRLGTFDMSLQDCYEATWRRKKCIDLKPAYNGFATDLNNDIRAGKRDFGLQATER